jgi:D-sedoheptulose 7-phosphate isomerase
MNESSFTESTLELLEVIRRSQVLEVSVRETGDALLHCLASGNKILTCGNGGSSADALHLAEELVGRYRIERQPLPAMSLCADVTAITCIGNDYGFDQIFSRQVAALSTGGDILVGFSTSGNSENIIKAFKIAQQKGVTTIFLGGKDGGKLRGFCDHEIIVPSDTTARIQEVHTFILHQWLETIDSMDWESLLK